VRRNIDVADYAAQGFVERYARGKCWRGMVEIINHLKNALAFRDCFPAGAEKSIEWYPRYDATLMKEIEREREREKE
jgi:hypothetical protein